LTADPSIEGEDTRDSEKEAAGPVPFAPAQALQALHPDIWSMFEYVVCENPAARINTNELMSAVVLNDFIFNLLGGCDLGVVFQTC
jgi:hypothetical protein